MFGTDTALTNNILDIGTKRADQKRSNVVKEMDIACLGEPGAFDLPNVSDVSRIYNIQYEIFIIRIIHNAQG